MMRVIYAVKLGYHVLSRENRKLGFYGKWKHRYILKV